LSDTGSEATPSSTPSPASAPFLNRPGRRGIVTVVTRNHLHYALCLTDSVRRFEPTADAVICLIDAPPKEWQPPAGSSVRLMLAEELGLDQWRNLTFQYTPFELACALKPIVLQRLLSEGYGQVAYIDADMELLGSLEPLWDQLSVSPVLLSPHLIRPYPNDGHRPGEELMLLAGTFNGGLVAVSASPVADRFLSWWSERLHQHCYVDVAASIFVDQKWLGLAPSLFPEIGQIRHPGINFGHWSLPQFEVLQSSDSELRVAGEPMLLMHYSQLTPDRPDELLNLQNRFTWHQLPWLRQLVERYWSRLETLGREHFERWPYAHARLDDGTPILPSWREAIRRRHPDLHDIEDPFATAKHPDLVQRYRRVSRRAYRWRRDWRIDGPPRGTESRRRWRRIKGLFKRKLGNS
jgi:hypothetical protein